MTHPKPVKKKAYSAERKALVKEADRVFSLYIRKRDGHCVCCGTTENLQCGHLFTRGTYSTRWDEDNAFAQCGGCNLKHEHDTYPLTNYFLNRFGKAAYDELYKKHKTPAKFTNADLRDLIKKYKELL